MLKRNRAVANFPVGRFYNIATGAEVTTGAVTGTYRAGAAQGAFTGTAAYDATAKLWIWSLVPAAATDADDSVGWTFELAGCKAITYTVLTTSADPRDVATLGLTNLDAPVSSRSVFAGGAVASVVGNVGGSVASVTNPVTISAASVDAVWDEVQSGHTTPGTFGKFLDAAVSGVSTGGVSAADIATAVWAALLANNAVVASFGEALAAVKAALDVFTNFFVPATVSTATSAGSFVVAFTGSAPPAAGLVGLWCYFTTAGRAPEKQPITGATAVDATHVTLTFAVPFATAPQVGDKVAVG